MALPAIGLRRSLGALVGAAVLSVAIAACSPHSGEGADSAQSPLQQTTPLTPLPRLTATEQAREMVTEPEVLVHSRLATLSTLATECAECGTVLEVATAESAQRIERAGGAWDPWSGSQPLPWAEESVELISELPEPGFTPDQVGGYMAATASEHLRTLAQAEGISGADRVALSALLVGRYASSASLASEFAFDLDRAISEVPKQNIPTFVIDGPEGLGSDGSPSEAATQSGSAQSGSPKTSDANAQDEDLEDLALVQYDCISQAMVSSVPADVEGEARRSQLRVTELIQNRTVTLSAAGAADERGARCTLEQSDPGELLVELLRVDLMLTGSDDPDTREHAAQWAVDDIEILTESHPDLAPTVSIFPPLVASIDDEE